MWPRFGIKVGNSNLCIAHVKSEDGSKIEVIANKQGDRVSPACLLWNGIDEIECGLTAKQKMSSRPKQAVANSFQLLLPTEELSAEKTEVALKEIPCDYNNENFAFTLKCTKHTEDSEKEATHQLSPYEVQVQLFRAELELAHQYLNDSDKKPIVVLSIPSYYPEASWPLLAQAAEEAGFHVAQVIAEPTAAVLAYSLDSVQNGVSETTTDHTKYVLTIKSGGLFSHFGLYAIHNGMYSQLAASEPFPVGGRQYTEAIVQFICDEFQRKYKLDPHESRRSMAKIRTAAENCKHILTTLPSTQVYIDSLMDGVDFNSQMSRARFESLIQPVMSEFMQTLNDWLERTMQENKEVKRIDSIVLLGATMRIPKLQTAVAARFPDAQLHASISADEAVAVGCARQAIFLLDPESTELQAVKKCACAEEEVVIWHGDDEANAEVIVEKGDILPCMLQLDVKRCKNTEDAEVFRLRAGENIYDVRLKEATLSEEDIFQIQAEVSLKSDEEQVKPIIRLSYVPCILETA